MSKDEVTHLEHLIKKVRIEMCEARSLVKDGKITIAWACFDRVRRLITKELRQGKEVRPA